MQHTIDDLPVEKQIGEVSRNPVSGLDENFIVKLVKIILILQHNKYRSQAGF